MLQFYLFCVFQHFDHQNYQIVFGVKILWVLEYCIRRYCSFYLLKPQVLLFYFFFFVSRLFKYISVTILAFFEKSRYFLKDN